PLLLLYARRSTPLVHFLPAAIAFALVPPIELMLVHQFTYTGLTAFVAFREDEMLWPRRLVIAFACVHAAQLIRYGFHDVAALRNIVPITLSLGIMALALVRFAPPSVKYRKAPLPAETTTLLDVSMREQRLYLDPALSLQTFAQRAGVSPHHVSRALSESGSSFYEYVNRFRVAEACARLDDPASELITVDALAEGAGFSSRSSFYAAFRKAMGMTPTEYRKRTLSEPAETDKVARTPA
ncbi:MAG TPA: AraC family transcriptional regulator, partial [Thermoanaerobaculia bacterium]|nr:AraC family transcriptional regulator [Thermoanaerobaculia bacterium]